MQNFMEISTSVLEFNSQSMIYLLFITYGHRRPTFPVSLKARVSSFQKMYTSSGTKTRTRAQWEDKKRSAWEKPELFIRNYFMLHVERQ